MRAMDRRAFVRWAGAAAAGAAAASWWPRRHAAASWRADPRLATLRIWLVRPATGSDTADGARLGASEGHSSLALFGRRLELLELAPGEWASTADAEATPSLVVLALADEGDCVPVVSRAAWRGVPVLNAACSADALRRPDCHPHLVHVTASEAMRRAAQAHAPADARSIARVELWHHQLERYGAAQLNARFAHRWGRAMTGAAWAGWMAVKMGVEACLRGESESPEHIRAYLSRGDVAFDGHKGVALSIDGETRQLRQPLYVVVERPAAMSGAQAEAHLTETPVLPVPSAPRSSGAPAGGAEAGACRAG